MRAVEQLNVTVWGDGEPAVFVHGSLGSGADAWTAQRPLADSYRLLLVDRRGFGESPGPDAGDFVVDAEDLESLFPGGAHLVGHSYGGVAALLAAARMPDSVRSLTVIEPPALGLVRGDEVVERFITELDAARREATSADEYLRRFFAAFGVSAPQVPRATRDVISSWHERDPAEADVPLEELRAAPFPKLVVRGAWDIAPTAPGRHVFHAVCDVLVDRLSARSVTIPGAAHSVPRVGDPFNQQLRRFWETT